MSLDRIDYQVGDSLDLMRSMPDGSVDAVVCSPPFLALRDYNGLAGQWGSEPDPARFLDNLLALAVEARRVLAPHGSIAWELGDTYAGSGGGGGDYMTGGIRYGQRSFNGSAQADRRKHARVGDVTPIRDLHGKVQPGGPGWPLAKSLCLVPTLFAGCLAYGRNLLDPGGLQFEPWRVRNVIVWARNNPPVGALGDKVRPATSYITVACPSGKRWFDLDAVRGPGSPNTHARVPKGVRRLPKSGKAIAAGRGGNWDTLDEIDDTGNGAPPTDYWTDETDGDLAWLVNTQGSSLSHYAMWPPKLAERLVLSMVPGEVCRDCGEPRRRQVGPVEYLKPDGRRHQFQGDDFPSGTLESGNRRRVTGRDNGNMARHAPTLGWSDCGHDDYRPGLVVDPFAGTGTTLAVAAIHGRDAIGFDLDPANPALLPARYEQCWRSLGRAGQSPVTEHGEQGALL